MKKNWIAFISLLLVILIMLLTINRLKKEHEEIKIGAILPLTGESALIGEWGLKGLKLGEEYINKNGGIKGVPIKILIEDGQGDPKFSIGAYGKLVKIEKVCVLTSIISSVDLALVPLAKKDGILFLSNASHPELSNAGPLIFRHAQTVQQESNLIFNFISGKMHIANLAYMNDEYSIAFKNQIEDKIRKTTIKYDSILFDKGETDFSLIAIKILNNNPDLVIISGVGRNLGLLITKLKERGFKGEIIVTLGFVVSGADKSAGSAIKGVKGVFFDLEINSEDYKRINELHNEKYKDNISIGSVLFFNSLLLISNAIEKEELNPEKMASFISMLKVFDGIGEKMFITNSNDINPSIKIIEF